MWHPFVNTRVPGLPKLRYDPRLRQEEGLLLTRDEASHLTGNERR